MDKIILHKATAYCAASEHCESELRKKLDDWNADADSVDDIIEYLRDNDYINDSRYCRAYVHDKFAFSKWGRIKMSTMLRQKHLPQADIQLALAGIDEEEYKTTLTELLQAKEKSITYKDERDKKAKLARFAAGRGFESSLIYAALSL